MCKRCIFSQLDLEQVQDVAPAKQAIVGLLNLVEALQAIVRELQAEVQRLRDENHHLKGELWQRALANQPALGAGLIRIAAPVMAGPLCRAIISTALHP